MRCSYALPYPAADRLVRVHESFLDRKGGSVSVPNYRDWVAQGDGFEQLAAWSVGGRNLQAGGEAEHLRVVAATSNLFSVLRASALLGRTFVPGQDEPGKGRVVVLSESLWRRRFGGDRSVLGRVLELDGSPAAVIGVMPASFVFPPSAARTDLWAVFDPSPQQANARDAHFLSVLGRLKPGISLERAGAQMKGVAAALEKEFPEQQAGRSVVLQPLREAVVGRTRPALLILLGAVVLVLVIACANVANLLLARAAVRRREVAIRLALGASRARLIRQLLVESLVLALAGTLVGSLLARWGLAILVPLAVGALPISGGIPIDGRVLGFLLLVTLLSALAFGLAPAFQASSEDIRDVLNSASGKATSGKRQQRFRNALVTHEIALSLVLLISAGLLLRGFLRVSATPPGLDACNVLTAHVTVADAQAESAVPRLYRPLLERLRHLPGVRSAAITSMLPIQSFGMNGDYAVEGRPAPKAGQEPLAEYRVTSPQYFASLGIPILRGREFEERDGGPGTRWALINEALARQQFPGENPLGRRLRIEQNEAPLTILGVVGNVRGAGLDREPAPEIYFPYTDVDAKGMLTDSALVIRTAVPPARLAADLRAAVHAVDPGLPLHQIATMEEVIFEFAGQPPAQSLAARPLRGDRARPLGRRALRRDLVPGGAAHPGDRRPPRSRSADPGRGRPGDASGSAAHPGRNRPRAARRPPLHARPRQPDLRRQRAGSADVRRDRRAARRGGAPRHLDSGRARRPRRSPGGDPAGVGGLRAGCHVFFARSTDIGRKRFARSTDHPNAREDSMTMGLGSKFSILQQSPLDHSPEKPKKPFVKEAAASGRWVASRYNIQTTTEDGRLIVWNTFKGAISIFPAEQRDTIKALLTKRGGEGKKGKNLIGYLADRGFLVAEGTNEYRLFQQAFGYTQYRQDALELILLASEDCNFRCEYCYEEFARGTMKPEVRESVKKLVRSRISKLSYITVSWFGGEPLYGLPAIEDLAPFFRDMAIEHSLPFHSDMTTNGYLLTPDRRREAPLLGGAALSEPHRGYAGEPQQEPAGPHRRAHLRHHLPQPPGYQEAPGGVQDGSPHQLQPAEPVEPHRVRGPSGRRVRRRSPLPAARPPGRQVGRLERRESAGRLRLRGRERHHLPS